MSDLTAAGILARLPASLRQELIDRFSEIEHNFRERRWEPSELNGGKFCEVVYTVLHGHIAGSFSARAFKPANMVDACLGLQGVGSAFPRSVRVQVPRMLMALYEIRNNRGVGHVGGDVDPNEMDATAVLYCAKWIMAELVRIFHGLTPAQAAHVVSTLVERLKPDVWQVGEVKRVLKPSLSARDQALLLLYHEAEPCRDNDLGKWIEYSNPSVFRNKVLAQAHSARLIEYDRKSGLVYLSPLGICRVEEALL